MAYQTLAEFYATIGTAGRDALSGVPDDEIQTAIEAVDDEADDYLRPRYATPLGDASVSKGMKRHLARWVFADVLDARGRSPLGEDSIISMNRDDAKKYLTMLAKGVLVLNIPAPVLASETPAVYSDSDALGYSPRWGDTRCDE